MNATKWLNNWLTSTSKRHFCAVNPFPAEKPFLNWIYPKKTRNILLFHLSHGIAFWCKTAEHCVIPRKNTIHLNKNKTFCKSDTHTNICWINIDAQEFTIKPKLKNKYATKNAYMNSWIVCCLLFGQNRNYINFENEWITCNPNVRAMQMYDVHE